MPKHIVYITLFEKNETLLVITNLKNAEAQLKFTRFKVNL